MSWADFTYLSLRLLLALLAMAVSWATVRFTRAAFRSIGRSPIGYFGALLLAVAGLLSAYDGINNVIWRSDTPIPAENWLWLVMIDTILPIYAWLMLRAMRDRNRLLLQLQDLSTTDPLTGALNRRGFLDRAAGVVAQARRAAQPVVMLLLDLDHFKAVNDTFGHDAGDLVLNTVVRAMQLELRGGDLLGRLGGDEFVLLLPGSGIEAAGETADRILAAVRTAVAQLESGAGVGCSGGLTIVGDANEPVIAISNALSIADSALYDAKRAGRGHTRTAASLPNVALARVGTSNKPEIA